jgi:hypothetical protein
VFQRMEFQRFLEHILPGNGYGVTHAVLHLAEVCTAMQRQCTTHAALVPPDVAPQSINNK